MDYVTDKLWNRSDILWASRNNFLARAGYGYKCSDRVTDKLMIPVLNHDMNHIFTITYVINYLQVD